MSLEKLTQVEPGYGRDFVPRPFSLTPGELGELPVTVAKAPTPVLALRYPAIATRVQGRAVAWTQRAVYVEWEDRGTHRAWVWASAVEHARAGEAGASTPAAAAGTTPTNAEQSQALPNDEAKLRAVIQKLKDHGTVLLVVDQPETVGAATCSTPGSATAPSTKLEPHSRLDETHRGTPTGCWRNFSRASPTLSA